MLHRNPNCYTALQLLRSFASSLRKRGFRPVRWQKISTPGQSSDRRASPGSISLKETRMGTIMARQKKDGAKSFTAVIRK
jgi:hypothetical protein